MICPKCHGTAKTTFAYTINYKVESRCDYDSSVNGIILCCGGVQAQSEEKGLTNNNVRNDPVDA